MSFTEVRDIFLFDGLADAQLAAMIAASQEVSFEPGEVLWQHGHPAGFWWILLEGRIDLVRHAGREESVLGALDAPGRWAGGFIAWDPAGTYLATGRAGVPGRVLRVPAQALRDLLEGVPVVRHIIDGIFHTARNIEASSRARESLITLGTLSAGLAHELNNPAAASARAVDALDGAMRDVSASLRSLAECRISAEQYGALDALRREAVAPDPGVDALELADREDVLVDWLAEHEVEDGWALAPALASASLDTGWCERVLAIVGREAATPAFRWVVAAWSAVTLLAEVKESTTRISTLVAAVRSYSQMDRAEMQRVDLVEGLESTLTMLGHKLRQGEVTVERDFDPALPAVDARGGELNQVWTNLIDNALDAMGGRGTLRLSARDEEDAVVVEVADTGTGMPKEVAEHAFEAFYTTKEVGRGTGLGLDIARRIVVERHGGTISIDSAPGRTVLRVALPHPSGPSGPATP